MDKYKLVNKPEHKYPWQIESSDKIEFFKFYTKELAEFYCKYLNRESNKENKGVQQ